MTAVSDLDTNTYKSSCFSVFDIADTFINLGKDSKTPITNMKLQKLLYYVQGWHLALLNTPLFDEDFEKWTFGPVCPEVYQEFKKYKASNIEKTSNLGCDIVGGQTLNLIKLIWELYGKYDGIELSKLSHKEEPWLNTENFCIISKAKIRNYFCKNLKNFLEA